MAKFSLPYRIMVSGLMSLLLCTMLSETNSAAEKVKLVFWNQTDIEHFKADAEMLALFKKKHPEIEIEYIQVPEFSTKIDMAFAAGNEPDLYMCRGTNIQPYILAGQLLRVTPEIMTKKELEKIIDFKIGNSGYLGPDGEYYGVPYTVLFGHNGYMVNLDLFEQTGLAKPNTWEEFLQAGKKMTIRRGKIITQAGFGRTEWDTYLTLHSLIWQFGGEFYNPETKHFDYTTPEAEEALEFYLKSYLESNGPSFADDYTGFLEGRLGMLIVQAWMNSYTKIYNPEVRFDYWRVPPIGVKGLPGYIPTMGGVGLAATKGTKYPEACRELQKFVIEDPEALAVQCGWAGNVPANSSLWDLPIYEKGGRMEMVNWVFKTITTPSLVREGGVWPKEVLIAGEVAVQWGKLLLGETAVKEALTQIEKIANEMMKYYHPRYFD